MRIGTKRVVPWKVYCGAPAIGEDGNVELTPAHRAFLGSLAGVPQSQVTSSQGPQSLQTTGMTSASVEGVMQPIKIGIGKGKKKEEAAIIPITQKRSLLDDGEEDDKVGKDTVLLSRSTSTRCLVTIISNMPVAKGARIVPPTSSSRKVTIILSSAPCRFHPGPMLTCNIGRSPATSTSGTRNSQNLPYLIPCRRARHQRVSRRQLCNWHSSTRKCRVRFKRKTVSFIQNVELSY